MHIEIEKEPNYMYSILCTEKCFKVVAILFRPVARNFKWVVLLYKIVDLFNKIQGGPFQQNSGWTFSTK